MNKHGVCKFGKESAGLSMYYLVELSIIMDTFMYLCCVIH